MGEGQSGGLRRGHGIGRYRLERELGRGGFGITYLGMDPGLDRRVAVKEYFPSDWAWRSGREDVVVRAGKAEEFRWGLRRFQEEAKILTRVNHSNVVKVYAYEQANGTGYIVMEFVEGEPLSARLQREGRLREADICDYVLPIMDALEAVHGEDLLHRDIKPSNIMLATSGRGVLIDFGSARPTVRAQSGEATTVYTRSYAAYEQRVGDPESPGTDIYALGAVLYQCVSGEAPWDPMRRVEGDRMPSAATASQSQDYSARLLRLIDTALEVRSCDRPESVGDWQKALGESIEASVPRQPSATSALKVRSLAENGDVDAQFELGCLYSQGSSDVRHDDVEARFWFRMAAGSGHPRAQYRLCRAFADGVGADHDPVAAAEWESRARKKGAAAQYRLGRACSEEDEAEAEFWYRGAACSGHIDAQYELGTLYSDQWVEGKIIDAAMEQAIGWCRGRVEQGSTGAEAFLARGIDVGVTGSHKEFLDAEEEMRQFLEGSGDAASYWQADCAAFCLAYKYLRMAARQKHPAARQRCDAIGVFMLRQALEDQGWAHAFLVDLALEVMTDGDAKGPCGLDGGEVLDRFRLGCEVAQEVIRAGATISEYESAVTRRLNCEKVDIEPFLPCWRAAVQELVADSADLPAFDAKVLRGSAGDASYQYERGLVADYEGEWEEAETWYTRAAEQGHAKAQFAVGMMFFDGKIEGLGLACCVETAVSYCLEAAAKGLGCASAFLKRNIEAGLEAYRRSDDWEAEREFRRLAEQGHAEAEFRLGRMYLDHRISVDFDVEVFEFACEWMRMAATHGHARAEYLLYAMLAGDHVFADYTVDPVDHVEEAQKWYWKAAGRAPEEQYGLGLRSEGDPELPDEAEAGFWYGLAADRGHLDAQFRHALLSYCAGGDTDEMGAAEMLHWAAAAGHPLAEALIGYGDVRQLTPEAQARLAAGARPEGSAAAAEVPSVVVAFPEFATHMLASSRECKEEPRLLAGLYRTYRRAARFARVAWAKGLSSDTEIDAWYEAGSRAGGATS